MHGSYAESLFEFGSPLQLWRCQGWLLRRKIPDSEYHDAMGCYPIFSCVEWSRLREDLEDLCSELVSAVLVTDPFGTYDVADLKESFKDIMIPFKQHFITDLSRPRKTFVSAHHQRNARRALRNLNIEKCSKPAALLDDWTRLYRILVKKHGIKGLAAFSCQSFAKQLMVPGIIAFRAERNAATEGMLLWYVQGDVAYYHLGAYSERGYELGASFALFSYAIDYFVRQGLRWLNLGGGAGVDIGVNSGLSRFKQGWSTGTRTAYFCGRIFDKAKYNEIVEARSARPTNYFPAYRFGEFR